MIMNADQNIIDQDEVMDLSTYLTFIRMINKKMMTLSYVLNFENSLASTSYTQNMKVILDFSCIFF